MKNEDIIMEFLKGREKPYGKTSLSVENKTLYSYGVVLAKWQGDELLINKNVLGKYSVTTSRHYNLLKKICDENAISYELVDM